MTKRLITFFIIFILYLTCQDPILQDTEEFKMEFISPSNGSSLTGQTVSIDISLSNYNSITNLYLDVNGQRWKNLSIKNDINLSYSPPNGLIESEYIFKLSAQFDSSFVYDSITVFLTSLEYQNPSEIAFLNCCSNSNDFNFMKFPVTNQQYLDYLNNALSTDRIYLSNSLNIMGFNEEIFYKPNKGKIILNDLGQIEIKNGYDLHPVTGVSWEGAQDFALFYGWRLPTIDEWLVMASGQEDNEYPWGTTINSANANYGGNYLDEFGDPTTTPIGYFNGKNESFDGACTINSPSNIGAYDIVGNVREYTSTFFNSSVATCGGDYNSSGDFLKVEPNKCTNIPININSSTTGFRCVADLGINIPDYNWNGVDNGFSDECGICGGDGFLQDCFGSDHCENMDCNGTCEGNAFLDNCGICIQSVDESSCVLDCSGNENGVAYIDECGSCYCNGQSPQEGYNCNDIENISMDCAGVCDGAAFLDICEICSGGTSGHHAGSDLDCNSMCFGYAVEDECGICDGDNSSCADCEGVPNGPAYEDNCGTCDDDPTNDCGLDCAGIDGGTSFIDECGDCYCNGQTPNEGFSCNESENMNMDCNNICFGSAYQNQCGCVGGDTNLSEDWCWVCNDWKADNFYCNESPGSECCYASTSSNTCWSNQISGHCNAISIDSDIINETDCLYSGTVAPYAISYPESLQNDGSCEYWGCTDENADNFYNQDVCNSCPNAICEIGVCPNVSVDTCEYLGCMDQNACNYDSNANTDDGMCFDDGIYLNLVYNSIDNIIEINYSSNFAIAGFQFNMSGIEIIEAFGGDAELNGFTLTSSSNTILGFSFQGDSIPPGEGNLVNISFSGSGTVCLDTIVFSDISSDQIGICESSCTSIP